MRRTVTALLVLPALALAGCGSSSGNGSSGSGSGSAPTKTITVLAASSLTESFTTLGKQFEKAHPGTKVQFSFGPSSGLAQQIQQGSPADVFASASGSSMDDLVKAGDAGHPTDFVSNEMEVAVPPANPAHVTKVEDLAKKDVKVALCQAQVPCGTVAAQVFKNAGITVTPVSEEVDVKSVLTKVTLGEVDAGVVYVTDVRAAGSKVKGIVIPADVNASTNYPIATLTHSKNSSAASQFMQYVLSPAADQVLKAAGFSAPTMAPQ